MVSRFELPLPAADEAIRLARNLERRGLELQILQALVGRPHRYNELKPLISSKRDEILTRAVRRLRNDGILDQRSDVSRDPPVDSYELSDLGIRVVLALAERAALEKIARLARTGARGFADALGS